jgi:hypothetical protein
MPDLNPFMSLDEARKVVADGLQPLFWKISFLVWANE